MINNLKLKILRIRISSLGEINMTYQKSKHMKVKKKFLKAQSNIIDQLLSKTPTKEQHQPTYRLSTFLEPGGRFVNSLGERHDDTTKVFAKELNIPLRGDNLDDDNANELFQKKTGLIRTQNRINKPLMIDIRSKITSNQLKTIREFENTQGIFASVKNPITGEQVGVENSRDLIKALREHKFI